MLAKPKAPLTRSPFDVVSGGQREVAAVDEPIAVEQHQAFGGHDRSVPAGGLARPDAGSVASRCQPSVRPRRRDATSSVRPAITAATDTTLRSAIDDGAVLWSRGSMAPPAAPAGDGDLGREPVGDAALAGRGPGLRPAGRGRRCRAEGNTARHGRRRGRGCPGASRGRGRLGWRGGPRGGGPAIETSASELAAVRGAAPAAAPCSDAPPVVLNGEAAALPNDRLTLPRLPIRIPTIPNVARADAERPGEGCAGGRHEPPPARRPEARRLFGRQPEIARSRAQSVAEVQRSRGRSRARSSWSVAHSAQEVGQGDGLVAFGAGEVAGGERGHEHRVVAVVGGRSDLGNVGHGRQTTSTLERFRSGGRREAAAQPRNRSIRSASRSRRASRPRWIRDLTVPSETPVMSAISHSRSPRRRTGRSPHADRR